MSDIKDTSTVQERLDKGEPVSIQEFQNVDEEHKKIVDDFLADLKSGKIHLS
jgi:uncharacterized protein YggL (DUF469 family)